MREKIIDKSWMKDIVKLIDRCMINIFRIL